MKKSVSYIKTTGAILLAAAAISASPTYAHGTEPVKTESVKSESVKSESVKVEESKQISELPLVTVTEKERQVLSKRQVVIGTQDKPSGRRWVTAKIKINATPSVVWDAVHQERGSDPDLAYSKVLEENKNKNESTIEQKFQLLPIVGTSVCVIQSSEIPGKRIDYHLLKSDRFKAVEGSWILQPTEDGATILELGSYIDIGVPAPRSWVEGIAGKKLERRLGNVRKVAEAGHSAEGANGKSLAHSRSAAN